jgi:hypothetical protein
MTPSDPFDEARLLVERACELIAELEAESERFFTEKPGSVVIEPDHENGQYIHKLRLGKGFSRRFELSPLMPLTICAPLSTIWL